MVHFVGAGPGACDLITVRGMNRIKEADVIIYAGSLIHCRSIRCAHKHINHIAKQRRCCLDFFPCLNIHLVQCPNIGLCIDTKLSRSLPECIIIRMLRQHLSANYTSQHRSII